MIKVACAGFSVAQKKYQNRLRTVEMTGFFDAFPRISTMEKWDKNAAPEFEFVICASRLITHPIRKTANQAHKIKTNNVGYFQDTPEVRHAFQKSWLAAETLKSRIILFRCPEFMPAHPDYVQRLQNFFRPLDRGKKHFVWEPPSAWPLSLVETLSKSLYLTPAANPLAKTYKPTNAPMRYFRIGVKGKTKGNGAMSDLELRDIKAACDRPLSYVVFNNGPTAFADAIRFQNLIPI